MKTRDNILLSVGGPVLALTFASRVFNTSYKQLPPTHHYVATKPEQYCPAYKALPMLASSKKELTPKVSLLVPIVSVTELQTKHAFLQDAERSGEDH